MRAHDLIGMALLSATVTLMAAGCREPEYVAPVPPVVPAPPSQATSEQSLSDRQASRVVAQFLGLPAGDVTTESSDDTEAGHVFTATVASKSGSDERVRMQLSADMQTLRSCRWLNEPPEGEPTLTPEHAKLVAQALYDRWFPQVPVNMAREAIRVDESTFLVNWVARLKPDVYSGDRVMALVSAVDGRPLYYEQYAAVERPEPEELPVQEGQALATARRAFEAGPDGGRRVEETRAILLLSAPQSPQGDPLWFVEFVLGQSGGAEPPPSRKVAVNGYTGEVATDLLEVFTVE